MEWKKASAEMNIMLEKALETCDCERRTMFGCPAYFVNGNMFAGVFANRVFLRLSEEDRREILETVNEAEPFEPMEGRVMREYVSLPEPAAVDRSVLDPWIERSYRYARELP